MPFHEQLLALGRPAWSAMLGHAFLAETAAGSLPDAAFANWVQQDYLFVQQAARFVSILVSKAPSAIMPRLALAIPALHSELELFERMAAERGVTLHDVRMTPACHAYVQFMLAAAATCSFEEGFTLLYGAEKAYLDSWTWVRENMKAPSPWDGFIHRWSDEAFRHWVNWLESALDTLAARASPTLRQEMTGIFLLAGQYELRFWDMALHGERWPV